MFCENTWVVKIEPWTLGSDVKTTAWVTCPTVEAFVPEVIGVGVGSVLNTVVTFAVHPVLSL